MTEKNIEPTTKKIFKLQKHGILGPKSKTIGRVFCFGLLLFLSPYFVQYIFQEIVVRYHDFLYYDFSHPEAVKRFLTNCFSLAIYPVICFFIIFIFFEFLINFIYLSKRTLSFNLLLKIDINKFNPKNYICGVLIEEGKFIIVKFVLSFFLFSLFIYFIFKKLLFNWILKDLRYFADFDNNLLDFFSLVRNLSLIFLLGWLICSFYFARKKFNNKSLMTLQEFREDLKESTGDPYIKSLQLHNYQMILGQELESRVKNASIILVNF